MIRAGPAHAEALAAIHAESFPPRERWGADAFALHLPLPGVLALIADAGGLVLARVAADEAEILTLAVTPPARRRGLGRQLLGAAGTAAVAMGAVTMFLEVSEANHPARALYAACGFVPVGRRRQYYADGSDALVLRRMIIPTAVMADPSRKEGGGSAPLALA